VRQWLFLLNAQTIEAVASGCWIVERLDRTITHDKAAQRRPTDIRQVILVLDLITQSSLTLERDVNVTAADHSGESYRRGRRHQHQEVHVGVSKRRRGIAQQLERVGRTIERDRLQIPVLIPHRHPSEGGPTRGRDRECPQEVGRLLGSTPPARQDGEERLGLVRVTTGKATPNIIGARRIMARVIAPFTSAKESDVVVKCTGELCPCLIGSNFRRRAGWTIEQGATRVGIMEVHLCHRGQVGVGVDLRIVREQAAIMIVVFRFPRLVTRFEGVETHRCRGHVAVGIRHRDHRRVIRIRRQTVVSDRPAGRGSGENQAG